ncbi:MAG: glucose-1-phosphate adenylyltransferase [Acidobacteriota bacterium]|jgi:glucose-1-phosphate adenylyltransferase
MEELVAVILGGGAGERLFPLTRERSKPAVPLAGKYRLIDIPVSNCINSTVWRMYVLTMFQSASLNSHLANSYRFDAFSRGFVQVLAAEQRRGHSGWFQGTADAVRQSWHHISDTPSTHVLILSGDHLYRMDYREFLRAHLAAGAEATIAVKPVTRSEAPELGLLKVDGSGRVVSFVEKPSTDEALDAMAVDTRAFGLSEEEAAARPFLASMGIYIFSTSVLEERLAAHPDHTDFGKHVIPTMIAEHHVQAYCFDKYWADIGTVRSFFEANLDLTRPLPRFNIFDPVRPIYTNTRFLPGAKINSASVENAILCEGSIVDRAMVRDSILGVRTRVQPGATIQDCYVMGADFFEPAEALRDGRTPVGIGEGSYIRGAIVDKNARIGRGVQLVNRDGLTRWDDPEGRLYVREGILVVPKNAVLPDGFVF